MKYSNHAPILLLLAAISCIFGVYQAAGAIDLFRESAAVTGSAFFYAYVGTSILMISPLLLFCLSRQATWWILFFGCLAVALGVPLLVIITKSVEAILDAIVAFALGVCALAMLTNRKVMEELKADESQPV